jgi:molybdenum cofactor biosynthesis protein A
MNPPSLYDNHGRPINYLRLAVTDRCNLRCFYCMPESGIAYLPKKELLTFEEIERLVKLLASLGISKVRLTGGEPFVRNDLMALIRKIKSIEGITDLHLTTNGILTGPYIEELKLIGITSVNLSLDTLSRDRFFTITRRDEFENTWLAFEKLIQEGIQIKINAVVMQDKNIDDLIPMVKLTQHYPISVRFIEEMPFNGEGKHYPILTWTYKQILAHLENHFGKLTKLEDPANATAYHYQVPGYRGNIGIIAAFSRTFCGSCNRIRVTAQGILKTCLYDDGVLNIKSVFREGASDTEVIQKLRDAFNHRVKDGFEAEAKRRLHPAIESMSTIGG